MKIRLDTYPLREVEGRIRIKKGSRISTLIVNEIFNVGTDECIDIQMRENYVYEIAKLLTEWRGKKE